MATKKSSPIKKIKTLQGKLKLDDETYRAMLEAQTGKTSCKDLTREEQFKVISHMQSLVDGKSSLANAGKNELLNSIATMLSEDSLHKNYGEAIADKMHGKKLLECSAAELLQVIDALQKHQNRH